MSKGRAFILVGHENWGKSETLRSLTDDTHQIRYLKRNNKMLFIRRMSNDDMKDEYLKFVQDIDVSDYPLLIITLCPNFTDKDRHTVPALKILNNKYELYFYVFLKKYGSNDFISTSEIEELKKYGEVATFNNRKDIESGKRAELFDSFIIKKMS